jgi:hypothetical protein
VAKINFLDADLKEIITQELCSLGHPPKDEEDLDTVLKRYLNLSLRIPPTIVWTVRQSKELANKILPQEITLGLQQLIEKAESGQDLKPHLSTLIDDPDYPDLMFYDWGIFHFHLGTNPHPKRQGFVERTRRSIICYCTLPYGKNVFNRYPSTPWRIYKSRLTKNSRRELD